ncbi:MAG: ABC transporter ATP-binding protein [Gammaproteobacteria bacterium]|nr:ABC transporter ATP-binding protein [Gammaproteobacteria bacterium]
MTLLQIEAVHKRYGQYAALCGLTLNVGRGEIVCLLGASGSGKTTLLRLVAGLDRVDSGRIVLDGVLVDAPGAAGLPPEKRRLGMVFQDYALWPHLTALENVALPLRARHGRDARSQARRMLERVGLEGFAGRCPHELSGGQQQRVALARALAVRPRLLLCDEPLSSLDAGLREELRDLIGNVVREHGLSALTITHDRREALALADRVGVIQAGRLLQIDPPRELWHRPNCEAVARFTDAFGPWPVQLDSGRLQAPWGACELDSRRDLADGLAQLYLRGAALRRLEPLERAAWPARARVLGSIITGDGVELRCDLHGVTLSLPASEALPVGAELALAVDPAQSLLYQH